MPYTYVTQGQALQELANLLYDPSMTFWTKAELTIYLIEALREWNALASYWRGEFPIPGQSSGFFVRPVWYDITDPTVAPQTLRPFTVQDVDLYNEIEYQLLEPPVGSGPWTGSNQFSIDDIMNTVQRRRDETLSNTGCTVSRILVNSVAGRTYLPDTTLDIRRIAWIQFVQTIGAQFIVNPLHPADDWGEDSYSPLWTTQPAGIPSVYKQSTQPPLSFDVDVPPFPGKYEVLTVNAGPQLVVGSPTNLGIPDDWTWIIKWGALADLLSRESNAKDPLRAKYCEMKYRQGMTLLAQSPAVLSMRADNIPLQLDAVQDLDDWNPTWQMSDNSQTGNNGGAIAGLNLVALSRPPQPDHTFSFGFTASVVQNAPIPTQDSDYIQMGRDDYDAMLGEAQHIAVFKQGGQEFLSTLPLHDRFVKQAALYNSKLRELGSFQQDLYEVSQLHEMDNPRLSKDVTNRDMETV